MPVQGYKKRGAGYDPRTFRDINGRYYPRVTSILGIIAKPALVYWAANQERAAFQDALLEVLAGPHATEPEKVLEEVIKVSTGTKAMRKTLDRAGDIGTQIHEVIHWWSLKILKRNPGEFPKICTEAENAVEAWKKWAKAVHWKPIECEYTVYSNQHRYAGTADCLCLVEGRKTLLDYKSGKAVYGEAFLQNIAYRQALAEMYIESNDPMVVGSGNVENGGKGWICEQGAILRLPKKVGDPDFEFRIVPDEPSVQDNFERFLAAKKLWVWARRNDGLETGDAE